MKTEHQLTHVQEKSDLPNRKKSLTAIILFLLLTACPWLLWLTLGRFVQNTNTENRTLAEFPVFSFETFAEYPMLMDTWLDDHLPFRSSLVEWNSAIDYFLLHSSTNELVVPGKEGWLFYTENHSTDYYKGRNLFSEKKLKKIAQNMQSTKDTLEAKGISFALVIAPNRERMYPEYLPDWYGIPAQPNALDQVVSYLREHTDVTVVSPYDRLMAEKEKSPEIILYHKTDTHWNDLAAYYAVRELLDALGISFPVGENAITIEKKDDTPGDMADLLNLKRLITPGETYVVSGYQAADEETVESSFFGHIRCKALSRTTGRILVARDSFCSAMIPVIRSVFTESDMVHHRAFENSLIDAEQPDYFVYEVVERQLNKLLKFKYE